MLEVRNVKKSFGSLQVLKDVSFKAEDGETIVILGASGSGKSTLLRCVEFFEKPDAGILKIGDDEIDMAKATKKQILDIRRKTAFVFQSSGLFLNKTALENVTEGLIVVKKMKKPDAVKKAEEVLDWVGVKDKKDNYPSQLSGGQQQRVAIARAMALEPEVILLDEPTSALDPELVGETLELIKRVAKTGVTMVIVTHEMSFAEEVADKVIFVDEGLVLEAGTPEEVFRNTKEERTKRFLSRIK